MTLKNIQPKDRSVELPHGVQWRIVYVCMLTISVFEQQDLLGSNAAKQPINECAKT